MYKNLQDFGRSCDTKSTGDDPPFDDPSNAYSKIHVRFVCGEIHFKQQLAGGQCLQWLLYARGKLWFGGARAGRNKNERAIGLGFTAEKFDFRGESFLFDAVDKTVNR